MIIGINANYFQKPATGIGVVTHEFMLALKELPEGKAHEWIWYFEGDVPNGAWPANWRFTSVSTWWSRDDILHRYLWERMSLPRMVKLDHCNVFLSLYQAATILPDTIRHLMLVHDLIPSRFPEYQSNVRQRLHYRAILHAVQTVDHFITPSESTKYDLQQFVAIPADKILVAPLGVSRAFEAQLTPLALNATLDRLGLHPGYLYHGGGLELRKNTQTLLLAYVQLIRTMPSDAVPPLVVSGTLHAETNPLAIPIRTRIAELKLTDHVRLLGYVADEDLPALYQGARAFIFPSRFEGFGLPVLEAFASRTPVITSNAGALAELVEEAALTVAPDDVAGLTEAIQSLLVDESKRLTLGAKGKERSLRYSWGRFSQTIVSALLQ